MKEEKYNAAANGRSTTWVKPSQQASPGDLRRFDDLQQWEQNNPFILTGYRPISYSYLKSVKSTLYFHNQSINIYSHLIGLVLFAIGALVLWHAYAFRHATPDWTDAVAFGTFFGGLFLCLTLSVAYHTFANHSEKVCKDMLMCDFFGILGLITASWIPGIFYGFFCQQSTSRFYWAMIVTVASGSGITISVPRFRHPSWDAFRTGMFLALGLSGILPMTYAALKYGIAQAHAQMGWGWFALEGVVYTTGTLIYAFRVPERWYPGKFDLVGSSHNIFHVLVLGGALAHLTGIVVAFDYNHHPDTRMC